MKVIIRVQSPQLKRFFGPRRIEKLPGFSAPAGHARQASPLIVWTGSFAIVVACLCLAMVAGLEPTVFAGLGRVSDSLTHRVTPAAESKVELRRPPEASYPYGSIPPMQSVQAPSARPSLAAVNN